MNFAKYLKAPFFTEHLRSLLLNKAESFLIELWALHVGASICFLLSQLSELTIVDIGATPFFNQSTIEVD